MRALALTLCFLIGTGAALAATGPTGRSGPEASATRPTGTTAGRVAYGGKTGVSAAGKKGQVTPARPRSSAGVKKTSRHKAAARPATAPKHTVTPARARNGEPDLRSESVLVVDQRGDRVLYEKNSEAHLSIASITKLMTAMVVLDAKLPMFEEVQISEEDVDRLKGSSSRLPLGVRLTRHELLHLALVASDNRAASALARSYPGGKPSFVSAMNRKARALGMLDTHFEDPTGLFPSNQSTARDLLVMVRAAYLYPDIREITTTPHYTVVLPDSAVSLEFRNTNRLLRTEAWDIGLSKTGYIREAGRCLVMQAEIAERDVLIVLLNSDGRGAHFGDAVRIRQWLEERSARSPARGTQGAVG